MRIKRIIRFITLKIIAMYYYYYSQFMITHFYIELTNLMTATDRFSGCHFIYLSQTRSIFHYICSFVFAPQSFTVHLRE